MTSKYAFGSITITHRRPFPESFTREGGSKDQFTPTETITLASGAAMMAMPRPEQRLGESSFWENSVRNIILL